MWAIPCLYVHPAQRGRGVVVALLGRALQYACSHGAPAVEGYPCAPATHIAPEEAFYGTETLFSKPASGSPGRPCRIFPRAGRLATRCGRRARHHPHERARPGRPCGHDLPAAATHQLPQVGPDQPNRFGLPQDNGKRDKAGGDQEEEPTPSAVGPFTASVLLHPLTLIG